jgi:hypothetical protein
LPVSAAVVTLSQPAAGLATPAAARPVAGKAAAKQAAQAAEASNCRCAAGALALSDFM